MTKLALIGLLFLCPFISNDFSEFLEDFVDDRECSKIALSGNLFSFKNNKDVESKLKDFQLYIFDEDDRLSKKDVATIKNEIRKSRMELLNMIKSDGSTIEIYVREDGDIITDLFMMVQSDDSGVLFNANGKIRYDDLKNMNIDFDGSDELKKL